jgi:threonine/homoserine efflux transporter RhtA
VGVIIGVLFMGEKVVLSEIIALVMIIAALLVTRIKLR